MADVEKVKQGLFRCFMKCNEPFAIGCGQCPYVGICYPSANEYESPETAALYTDTIALIDEMQAEIERLKAQKQKWLQNIADQQLAVSPTGYETEEGLAKRTGEWNGLQMAWEILTKE